MGRARGILKSPIPNEDILGTYSSLDGKTLEEVTGLSYQQWQKNWQEKYGPDEEDSTNLLTQSENAAQFVKDLSYEIQVNSGANYDLQLPTTFNETISGVEIGALLKARNELSKQNGLDFSGYLGQPVTLITYGVEDKDNVFANVDLIMDGNIIVGFWIDNHGLPPDFNVIVSAFQATSSENAFKAPKQSQQELYQDVFVTLLDPYIRKAIDDYYEQFLTISPIYTPGDVEILNVERPMGYRTFSYLIKLQIKPYVGPHDYVGVDQITINVAAGVVKVEKYEHLKSYDLPPNLQDLIKQVN